MSKTMKNKRKLENLWKELRSMERHYDFCVAAGFPLVELQDLIDDMSVLQREIETLTFGAEN